MADRYTKVMLTVIAVCLVIIAGNLYGSEYWTYLLPRRVGADNARRVELRHACRWVWPRHAGSGSLIVCSRASH